VSDRSSISPEQVRTPVPDISVIIVNWNLREYLRDCLLSLRRHRGGLELETIVVDNASSDGSAAMVEREFPEAMLIRNSENAGFSKANNQAMARARGRYLFLLNNDALVYEGTLPGLVGFMDSHPGAGACGPRIVNADGTLQVRSKGYYPNIRRAAAHFFLPARVRHRRSGSLGFYEFQDRMDQRTVDWLSGCALMVRRKTVEKVGMLDADVFMYCEDIDWCYRMNRAGWQVWYMPGVSALHYGGRSMKRQSGRAVAAHAAGLIAFYSKYHGTLAAMLFRLVLLTGYAAHGLGWLVGGVFGRGGGMDKLRRMGSGRRSGPAS